MLALPLGGAAGEILAKNTANHFDADWFPIEELITIDGSIPTTISGFLFGNGSSLIGIADVARTGSANTFTTGQTIEASPASNVALTLKAAGGQTANLQEWKDSSNAVKSAILPTLGIFSAGAFSESTSTAGVYIGITGGSSRILACDGNSANNFQFDNTGTGFRFLYPGLVTMQGYRSINTIAVPGDMQVGSNDARRSAKFWVRSNDPNRPLIISGQDFSSAGNTPSVRLDKFSSTNTRRPVVGLDSISADATDASRKGCAVLTVYDTAARESMRGEASGSAAAIGFLGAAAVTRPNVTGSRGGNAALASLLTALGNLGLITDSTTA